MQQDVVTDGVDLAKNVFQVYPIGADGRVLVRRQLRRGEVLKFFFASVPGRHGGMRIGAPLGPKASARLGGSWRSAQLQRREELLPLASTARAATTWGHDPRGPAAAGSLRGAPSQGPATRYPTSIWDGGVGILKVSAEVLTGLKVEDVEGVRQRSPQHRGLRFFKHLKVSGEVRQATKWTIRDRAKHHETLNSHVSVLQCAQTASDRGQLPGIILPIVRGLKASKFKRRNVCDLIVMVVELPLVVGLRDAIVVY